ncbi:unnamed protein product [Camellia sinensis]
MTIGAKSTWRLQRSGSCRASVVLIGKELNAVSFSKRHRQPGCWLYSCRRLSQHGCAGEGTVPCTNGAHGTNSIRRGVQSVTVGLDGKMPRFWERVVDGRPVRNRRTREVVMAMGERE